MSDYSSDFKSWIQKPLSEIADENVREAFTRIVEEAEPIARQVEIKRFLSPVTNEQLMKGMKGNNRRLIIAKEFEGLVEYLPRKASKNVFKAGTLLQTDYGHLYDQLVKHGLLEDTGKTDFIYYFTGEGEPSTKKLNWIGDRIYLSVLMSVLCNNRIPWTHMETVFQGLNTKSMKATLNKSMHPKNGGESYQKHCRFIKSFLSEA